MPVNSLARQVGLKIAPVVLETLIKRFFDRVKVHGDEEITKLRQDELLYDAAFNIIKSFFEVASEHTVEELQGFANTRTPSPPWVHVVRLLVPMSCCDEAAGHLITALGGEDVARRVVGGVKWWQVRGVGGIDAQWVTAKKDYKEAKKRQKMTDKSKELQEGQNSEADPTDTGVYEEEMDTMRCILYAHGGGYYMGSVDQERYSIQRHARKINGRVFAVNYRLAPQYPFPCAIHDLLAAYIFLIRPPPGAAHCPVKPGHIVIAGDSAGAGLALALLQVIRDSGLPSPAGGVLISPWCDLTHSFPSIHTNTATDVIPASGLSQHKPSTLWPPPSDEMTNLVQSSLRSRIRQALRIDGRHHPEHTGITVPVKSDPAAPSGDPPVDVGPTAPVPPQNNSYSETIKLTTSSGEVLTIARQVHCYAQNSQLAHPLISPVLSYLGGLPPLLVIASEKELLRDEIIYTAHKAANPEKYPIRDVTRHMYPSLDGIESRHGPTQVHLQVYDDAAHVLPVLFAFTTPAKFCYRAIAIFCKHVTGMPLQNTFSPLFPMVASPIEGSSTGFEQLVVRSEAAVGTIQPDRSRENTISNALKHPDPLRSHSMPLAKGIPKRSMSMHLSRAASSFLGHERRRKSSMSGILMGVSPSLPHMPTSDSEILTGNTPEDRMAGDPIVYSETPEFPSWTDNMIRERVSTSGVIRPLEPEDELDALHVPPDKVGVLSEPSVRRYIEGATRLDHKFSWTIKTIEKHRHRNLERSKKDTHHNLAQLQAYLLQDEKDSGGATVSAGIKEGLMALSSVSGSWGWAWAIDGNERPPPSSIVSRRDTDEARRLARVADKAVMPGDSPISGNNLWSWIVTTLSGAPGVKTPPNGDISGSPERKEDERHPVVGRKSRFSFIPKREVVVDRQCL